MSHDWCVTVAALSGIGAGAFAAWWIAYACGLAAGRAERSDR